MDGFIGALASVKYGECVFESKNIKDALALGVQLKRSVLLAQEGFF